MFRVNYVDSSETRGEVLYTVGPLHYMSGLFLLNLGLIITASGAGIVPIGGLLFLIPIALLFSIVAGDSHTCYTIRHDHNTDQYNIAVEQHGKY